MRRFFSKGGFTLIEVLVVIAIIGILVSIVSVNFNEAREQSRDKVRMSDLKQLQLAIELYKSQNGRYPEAGCGAVYPVGEYFAGRGTMSAGWGLSCTDYIVGLVPEYIAELPEDPNQEYEDNLGYIYTANADGTSYKLMAHRSVESNFVNSFANEFSRCPNVSLPNCPDVESNEDIYAVYSAGAENW